MTNYLKNVFSTIITVIFGPILVLLVFIGIGELIGFPLLTIFIETVVYFIENPLWVQIIVAIILLALAYSFLNNSLDDFEATLKGRRR